jgi:hypothetical protein
MRRDRLQSNLTTRQVYLQEAEDLYDHANANNSTRIDIVDISPGLEQEIIGDLSCSSDAFVQGVMGHYRSRGGLSGRQWYYLVQNWLRGTRSERLREWS